MDTFDFLSVLFSVIMGLALTEVLQSFRELMQARLRLRLYWPAIGWGVLMIAIIAQAWWGMFAMHDLSHWNFLIYSTVIGQITLLYLAAGTTLPKIPEEGPVDLRALYYANSRTFFTLLAVTVAATFGKDWILAGRLETWPNLLMLFYYFTLATIAAITKRHWYHATLVPLTALGIVTNAALLSFRL